ncbi:MAG: N-6 DNA methylase, partial [Spirochaetales bacterium]|nr:N-6 DNA methylase [Spirochaetales bacterium]
MSLHALSNQEKELGQIFTPPWVFDYILDAVGYQGTAVLNKTIMEPACGDGAFLTEIVSRYVTAAQSVGWPAEKIKEGLERHIYGIEIDKDWCIQCIYNLNAVIEPLDIEVRWNVLNANALTVGDYHGKMDYVVGNPPYVRVHNLDRATRKLLKENFFMCKKGMIDLYLAFYELGLLMLNNSGRLGYITPNSFMYNATSRAFREYVRENRLLKAIVNFKDTQLFDVSTYSAIVILDKGHR